MGDGSLAGRVAVVTGGGSGMGAAFCRRLATDGALVVVNDLAGEAAEAVAKEVGGEPAVFDVTDSAAFTACVDDVVARHGRLDVMVNNAGIAPPRDDALIERLLAAGEARMEGRATDVGPLDVLTGLSDDDWDRMIKVHLYGCFYGTRAALVHMQPARRGAIVNIASILALQPAATAPHYAAAKAAIVNFTRSVGREVAHLGVRVNAVCPGYIDTPLLAPFDEVLKTMTVARVAAGRLGRAEELAELVRFLAGDESSYFTGEILHPDGGFFTD